MLKGRLWEQYRRLLQPQRLGNGVGEGDVSGGGQSSSDPAIRELAQKIVLVSLSLARSRARALSLCMFSCVYICLASSMLPLLQDE